MLIDTHVHVISPDEEAYPLRPLEVSGSGWHEEIRVSAEDLVSMMDSDGVDGAVLVQAMSAYQADNAYLRRRGPRLGGTMLYSPCPDSKISIWLRKPTRERIV